MVNTNFPSIPAATDPGFCRTDPDQRPSRRSPPQTRGGRCGLCGLPDPPVTWSVPEPLELLPQEPAFRRHRLVPHYRARRRGQNSQSARREGHRSPEDCLATQESELVP